MTKQPIVLIVDDDSPTASDLRMILERRGVRVVRTEGADALAAFSRLEPHCVIVEEWLIDTRGTDFLIAMRGRNPAAFRVLMTAGSTQHLAVDEGATIEMVIPRPWRDGIIDAFVARLMERLAGR